jgi:uncharacterized protein YecE (DUF72 family)
MPFYVGTAGWNIPRAHAPHFPPAGSQSQLRRYATRLNAAEINSSFYRTHAPATYARWAAAVGHDFRFAVKMPQAISHERRLVRCREVLVRFLGEAAALGRKLGPLLLQLPPSLEYEERVAARFFALLRRSHPGAVVVEARHPSWTAAERLLVRFEIARVAADPPRVPGFDRPGGWPGLTYYRLHGSPRPYFSPYSLAYLQRLADTLTETPGRPVWCIFDNTGSGSAAGHAIELTGLLAAFTSHRRSRPRSTSP